MASQQQQFEADESAQFNWIATTKERFEALRSHDAEKRAHEQPQRANRLAARLRAFGLDKEE